MTDVREEPVTTLVPRAKLRLGWAPDLKDHRDRHYPTHRAVAQPTVVDLRDQLPPSYDQADLGSCTANAIAGALQFVQAKQGLQLVMPSRLFIYYNERAMEGTVDSDSGARIRDGIKSVVKLGYCPEPDWPYVTSQFTEKPSQQCFDEALMDQVTVYYRVTNRLTSMLHCLASGYPFVFGITVYESFMQAPGGDVPMPDANEAVEGGHAMLCVGYDQAARRFLFRNSWGTAWGDGTGHGTIPFEYLDSPDYGGDYWTIRQQEIP
jgi:C1A family cysteine protease